MKLTIQSTYLSIKDFPEATIPTFTLITGPNGAGKTHLLKAIQGGHVRVDIAPSGQNDVRFFDWNNLVPGDSEFESQTFINERQNEFAQYEGVRQQFADQIIQGARGFNLPVDLLNDPNALAVMSESELAAKIGDTEKAALAYKSLKSAVNAASQNVLGHNQLRPYRQDVERISKKTGRPLAALRKSDFSLAGVPSWGESEIFQNSLSRLFVAYRDLKLTNTIKQCAVASGRTDVLAMSNDEFIREYLAPPWQMVNDTFRDHGIDFEINCPDEFEQRPFRAALTKRSTHAEVRFGDLSSGERVLVSLTLCVYYANDRRQLAKHPKLLLLDEVDAPLHPQMARNFLSIITETLVKIYGIAVIATTHSPSTVALAPEESLYVMHSGRAGLAKISKDEAINVLLVGVPSLSISYTGRRQVFVESPNDAEIYDAAYQELRHSLESERSLDFIGAGLRSQSSGAHIHTGCDVVRYLVKTLVDSGNSAVFGLIDWDGKNQNEDHVHVLGHGTRNGLENVILDPLLVASLTIRDVKSASESLGLKLDASYLDFLKLPSSELQSIVDRVQAKVLPALSSEEDRVECKYRGGFSLQVSKSYLEMDDHKLEEAILVAFPSLNSIARGRAGQLMRRVVETIFHEQPLFIPLEIELAFRALLA